MEIQETLTLVIAAAFFLMVFLGLLIGIIVSISKRKDLEKENRLQKIEAEKQIEIFRAVAEAEENQKVRIASNLHDEIIPLLALTSRNLSNHVSELEKNKIPIDKLKEDIKHIGIVSNNIRDISHDLVPRLFSSLGLVKSLDFYIKQLNESGEITSEFHYWENALELPFSLSDQLIIYRICLEILNNLNKHANFSFLNVTLDTDTNNFVLIFAHNGNSVTTARIDQLRESSSGIGLKSMHSRTIVLGASIDYYSDKDVSFVKLIVPVKS